ncbi:MAG: aminotransferase class I/II-fold pyridoxal phosphate-dependent enzyme [Planctomycetaceae bacterium]|nr:aminotransferase class I/II-fold pyridoxal phosphate-dependent enzyme [Planctomycetaceae bacterium]
MIDLRSDTVTRPTPPMLQAMLAADVGDDVMGEDPTVNRLEQMMADLFDMEAAVFACSGTQSNQMGVRVHCIPGDELLINETGHIANFEGGAPAALSGVTVRTIAGAHGKLEITDLDGKVRHNDQHFCRTRLVCLENTTNLGGGYCYSLEHLRRVARWAREHQLRLHLDGARLFNAIVATGASAKDIGQCFDTISVCFSKGLGCPMGSILIGSAEHIQQARRVRKLFGGALRQAGFAAAAAIHAMENHVDRLAEDHSNARRLANLLAAIDGIRIDAAAVETNLVFFDIDAELGTAIQLAAALRERDILVGPMGGQRMRAVTHLDVPATAIETTASAIAECVQRGFRDQTTSGKGPYGR